MTETPVLLRTSERATFRRCRQQWEWRYLRGIEPVRFKGALAFGTMIHQALEAYYPPGEKRGQHPADAFLEIFDSQPEENFPQWDEDGERYDARDLGWVMLTEYVKQYGTDHDVVMVQPEMTFSIDVYDRQGNYLCTYVGKADGVKRSRSTGRVSLFEHKSAKTIEMVRINSGYGEQGLSYWWALTMWLRHTGVLKPDELIDSVTYNFLRKAMPDDRPINKDGHRLNKPKKPALVQACEDAGLATSGTMDVLEFRLREHGIDVDQLGEVSAKQPTPFFERQELRLGRNELRMFETRLRREAWEQQQVRAGKAPIYKNPTMNCRWDCSFVDVCEVHEMGGDWEGILELDFKEWDPYSDHELEAERRG